MYEDDLERRDGPGGNNGKITVGMVAKYAAFKAVTGPAYTGAQRFKAAAKAVKADVKSVANGYKMYAKMRIAAATPESWALKKQEKQKLKAQQKKKRDVEDSDAFGRRGLAEVHDMYIDVV